MHGEPGTTPRAGQYKLWSLLAATAVVAVLLAFGRLADEYRSVLGLVAAKPGALPAEWAIVIEAAVLALMISAAARAGRFRALFASAETMIWLGGVCLFTAGFYRYPYGLQASYLSEYGMVTQYLSNPIPPRLPMLICAWYMGYGAIAVAASFMAIMGWTGWAIRWRWIVAALYLACVTAAQMAMSFWPVKWGSEPSQMMLFAVSRVALAAVVVTLVFVRDSSQMIQWLNLIAGSLLLRALYPQYNAYGAALTLTEVLRFTGQGYPLLVVGDLLLLIGSISMLCTRRGLASTR